MKNRMDNEKKPYRSPRLVIRKIELGVYGDYDGAGGGCGDGPWVPPDGGSSHHGGHHGGGWWH